MGGAFAPKKFQFSNVCKHCNNVLGTFVDASYGKSWVVSNNLATMAHDVYYSLECTPIPLVCLGPVNIPGIQTEEDAIVEWWTGPSGASVIWIRPDDERTYWYTGGNPGFSRKQPSVAYFIPNSPDETRFRMALASFLAHFKGKNARKVMFAHFEGMPEDFVYQGFNPQTESDKHNYEAIHKALESGSVKVSGSWNMWFDHRFMAKMVLAMGYSFFGNEFIDSPQAIEARKTLWPRDGETQGLRGTSILGKEADPNLMKFIGYPSAITIIIIRSREDGYSMTVTVNQRIPFFVELAPASLTSPFIDTEDGYALLLFPNLKKAIEMTKMELMLHQMGYQKHPELEAIEKIKQDAIHFHKGLAPHTPNLKLGPDLDDE